ncbi:hypothetical protein [Motilibacter aurantiacus]|uniref:hypothetical protein n=1 Tax=Motilibacter aurantiacus TaxID=2714955 RepID=UPI00140AD8F6|nr:hypothetical protein [Motilibacter aurantiacus]NHC46078.1 hypothetical protein [Motilibacter aurantiacus]
MIDSALARGAVAWRVAVTVVAGALLTAGTLWGQDDAWPFGPFRMYSTSTDPSGVVTVLTLERQAHDGRWAETPLTAENVGMNRAEAEGQQPRLVADPALLARFAEAHERLHPEDAPWPAVRLVRVATVLEDRRPTGEVRREVLATWRR